MARPTYDVLPAAVRLWVDDALQSPVRSWTSETGGFSPGVAARVSCADGRRAFVKAVSAEVNPHSPGLHRSEAKVTAALPRELGAPALLATYDDGTWVALLLDEVDGRPPAVPWRADELAAALRALDRLSEVPAVPGVPTAYEVLGEEFTGWAQLAADPPADLEPWQAGHLDDLVAFETAWPEAGAGDRLLHLDARGDNMLVRPDGEVVLVDWPWAAAGDPVMDIVGFVPSAMLAGVADPEAVLRATVAGRAASPAAVTSLLTAFTGMMEWARRQPPPPGLETVRAFQAAQAGTAGAWLRQRTGWG
ncbi:MAG: phosphotransferase [Frankiaceae bacterium]|nr:phosphotransferase [Frankiaceae bacterium]